MWIFNDDFGNKATTIIIEYHSDYLTAKPKILTYYNKFGPILQRKDLIYQSMEKKSKQDCESIGRSRFTKLKASQNLMHQQQCESNSEWKQGRQSCISMEWMKRKDKYLEAKFRA